MVLCSLSVSFLMSKFTMLMHDRSFVIYSSSMTVLSKILFILFALLATTVIAALVQYEWSFKELQFSVCGFWQMVQAIGIIRKPISSSRFFGVGINPVSMGLFPLVQTLKFLPMPMGRRSLMNPWRNMWSTCHPWTAYIWPGCGESCRRFMHRGQAGNTYHMIEKLTLSKKKVAKFTEHNMVSTWMNMLFTWVSPVLSN